MAAVKGLRVQKEAENQGGPADLGSSEKWPLKRMVVVAMCLEK